MRKLGLLFSLAMALSCAPCNSPGRCDGAEEAPAKPPGPRPDRAKLLASMKDVGGVGEKAAQALKDLPEAQLRTVLDLVAATEALAMAGSGRSPEQAQTATKLLAGIHRGLPQAGSPTPFLSEACWAESVAYAAAAAKCKESDEAKCPDTWGPAAAEINCLMIALLELRVGLGRPGPLPGPASGAGGSPRLRDGQKAPQ